MSKGKLATILTVRNNSERLPGKVMSTVDISGKTLTEWIIRRLEPLGTVILATTTNPEDKPLLELAGRLSVPAYAGSVDDVVTRIDEALNEFAPDADFVLRALGDCPFMNTDMILYMVRMLRMYGKDYFVWHTAPYANTVYGSRESPYSRIAWDMLAKQATVREHVDTYFQENRKKFDILYHEPPASILFRNYRLELDWDSDLALIREIAKHVGMLASVENVITFLDTHPDVVNLNCDKVEATGPTRYSYSTHRQWVKLMEGKPIVSWDGTVWRPPSPKAQPVFCKAGSCFLGFGEGGILHTREQRIVEGYITCQCGNGLAWGSHRRK